MDLPDIPLLGMLRERMSWLNARQNVLSQNVANADTPGFTAQDLKPVDFEAVLKNVTHGGVAASGLSVTDPHHIPITQSGPESFSDMDTPDITANPSGNSVSLEDEMIKVADTQAQFQAATNLYSKAIDMMRTAIGKSSS